MTRSAISIVCIICLCLAGIGGTAAAASVAPEAGGEPVATASAAFQANETEDNETSTPIGIGLGPIRVTDVWLTEREITVGEATTVVARVHNRGDEPGTITVTASAGEIEIDERTVRVEPDGTRELRFTYQPEEPGRYLILVNGRSPGVLTVHRIERVTTLDIAANYVGWSGLLLGSISLLVAVVLSALVAIGRAPRLGTDQLSVRAAEQLWIAGSVLLLLGVVAGSGLTFRGAQIGVLALVGYGIYAVLAVLYRSGA